LAKDAAPEDKDSYKVGDKISGMRVFEVQDGESPSDRKIRVSLKKLTGELKAGDSVEGAVKRVMKFGIFFDIGTATDALCPERFVEGNMEDYQVGEKKTLKVVELKEGKLTVGMGDGVAKEGGGRAKADVSQFAAGDKVEGKVVRATDFGLFVNIGGADALVRADQLPKDLKEYKTGDNVPDLKILNVDKAKGQIEATPRKLPNQVTEGDKLEGTVKSIADFGVFFDGGLAVDVLCPTRMLAKDIGGYTVGEVADLIITQIDKLRVSVTTKSESEMGIPLYKLPRGAEVTGKVKTITPGMGIFFDIGASEDALLRERLLPKPIGEYSVGEEVEGLLVVKVDASAGNVEVTSKDSPAIEQGTPLSQLKAGQKVDGKVTRSANFGVFVDIGAERDALYPSDQLDKPNSEYKPGDELKGLTIAQVNVEASRLVVSTKKSPSEFEIGESVDGEVKKIMPFGIFVDIGASTQGLVPARLLEKEPTDYTVGQKLVGLKVEQINAEAGQISLGELDKPKARDSDMDTVSLADLEIGKQIKGIVRKIQDYGIFVDIGLPRKDALMPSSLLGKMASSEFESGAEIMVYIAGVDAASERVTLSMEEPPEGGVQSVGRVSTKKFSGNIPPGDMEPDREFWLAHRYGHGTYDFNEEDDEEELWDEPIPWKEWETKYPGLVKHAEKEHEIYLCTDGWGFSGIREATQLELHSSRSQCTCARPMLRRQRWCCPKETSLTTTRWVTITVASSLRSTPSTVPHH